MQQKRIRPRWWPAQERDEPLTMPAGVGTAITWTALVVGALLLLEVLLPATGHHSTPLGVVLDGVVQGSLTGLVAVGLILVYRTTRILNFAQVALGASAGAVTYQLVSGYGVAFAVAVPFGLLAAAAAGVIAELLLRRFSRAPRLVVTIATLALAPTLTQIMSRLVATLNPAPPGQSQLAGSIRSIPPLLPQVHVTVAPITFGFAQILTVAGSLLAMLALALFLRRTRWGQAVRGAAENSEAAWLLGINVRLLSTVVWALAALLSGLGAVFQLAMNGIDTSNLDGGAITILPALVAAMVAGMESMPQAMAFSTWLMIVKGSLQWALPGNHLFEPGLLLLMLGALVLQRGRLQRRESKQGGAWEAVRDVRPTPVELLAVPAVRRARIAIPAVGIALLVLLPFVVPAGQAHSAELVMIMTIVAISLMLLTGWAGQVSLGHYALVAVGAVVGGGLTVHGWSFWLALPFASLLSALLAVAVGVPALRIRGLYLAPVTLAFAVAASSLLFDPQLFGWLLPGTAIARPHLLSVDLGDERWMYLVVLAFTAAVVYVTVRLRRTRFGRVLIALRDNDRAAQSVGVSLLPTRLAAFAVSGFLAGLAGVLLAHVNLSVEAADFGADRSLFIFLLLVVGGLGNVSGAILGAAVAGGLDIFLPGFANLAGGSGALAVLLLAPGGLSQLLYGMRDAVLRVVALRLRIVVPSLFVDYDPEARMRRQMPLSPPSRSMGLAALPVTQRYARPSWLWNRGRGPA
jgi:branched-chain amino acid transport system permease protein